jgi:hypothetical protein
VTTCRFAPTASGRAHLGTLLAGLLCWLDARSRGARFILRLEDIDRQRCLPAYAHGLIDDLAWLGLDWDDLHLQSAHSVVHAAALDALAAAGVLYPSSLSRSAIAALGRRAPDGGWAYDNRERDRPLPPGGWRACREALRCRLPAGVQIPQDEGGLDLAADPAATTGDPIVRTRHGDLAYHLAVVVDDHRAGVDRIIRGRDLAPATATHQALRELLGFPHPIYRHHLLLLDASGPIPPAARPSAPRQQAGEAPNSQRSPLAAEEAGPGTMSKAKLAKYHRSLGGDDLRRHLTAPSLCGFLAHCAGLRPAATPPCTPAALLEEFSWSRIRTEDVPVAVIDGLPSLEHHALHPWRS